MKKINIFIITSDENLREESLELGDFFGDLSSKYIEKGVILKRISRDDYEKSVDEIKERFEEELKDSLMAFFLFFKKIGDTTLYEFETALKAFKESKSPKIFTYFRYIESKSDITDEVKLFMDRLDKEVGHYYNMYNHMDTVKLGILMQLKNIGADDVEITVEDSQIKVENETVFSTDNIPIFCKNSGFVEKKAELSGLTDEFLKLKKQLLENPDDEEINLEYSNVVLKRAELKKAVAAMEKNTFELFESMVKRQSEGDLSPRQAEGYRLLEMGDYDGALEALNLEDIYSDIKKNEAVLEYSKEALQQNVNELLSRIETLQAKAVTPQIIDEIYEIYKKACELSEDHNLDKDVLHLYVNFLYEQTKYFEALEVLQRLEHYYAIKKSDKDMMNLYNQFGMQYYALKELSKAEEYYLDAIKIADELKKQNIKVNEHDLASSYNNLANIYTDIKEYKNAEKYLLKAMKICKSMASKNAEKYEPDLALNYNNLGNVYDNWGKSESAEKYYFKAIKIQKKFSGKASEKYEADLALSYNNLACLYGKQMKFEDAEKYFLKAVKIYERISLQNPEKIEIYLAQSYNNLGDFCLYSKKPEAKNYFLKAMRILERLVGKSAGVFEAELAQCYNNIAVICDKDESELYFIKAEKIYLEIVEKSPEIIGEKLVNLYFEMGLWKWNSKRHQDARGYFEKALECYKRFSVKNDDILETMKMFLGIFD